MNFLKKIFNTVTISSFVAIFLMFSCSDNTDDTVVTPPRAYDVEYAYDKAVIDTYLNDYTFDYASYLLDASKNVVFSKFDSNAPKPKLMSLLNATTFPKLLVKEVALHDITYKVYYLFINEGVTAKKPSRVDDVLVGYRGFYLENQLGTLGTVTDFENNPYPTTLFSLGTVIRGWGEILPLFGTGTIDATAPANNPTSYTNYGVGAIFIPSGLGYFNQATTSIPSYSPLVFTIKLYDVKRADQDGDKIESMNEIVRNADDTFTFTDTDVDGIPDYLDTDDDNDGVTTINEIKNGNTFYSFDNIPGCNGLNIDPARIKRHLVKCQL
jgi:hypothetical protein